ncbi:hypothetical protein ACI2L1_03220 [Streptomyces sp. NPDC019531]|uniref:hypothetical protein n=1 Tax=Streptomyces sp. NPDC019531 TaxID=3365062 RepID=UPI00384F1EB9
MIRFPSPPRRRRPREARASGDGRRGLRLRLDTPLDDTLTALRAVGSHLAAVTGETGTVLGFVTMEDVLTELVGPTPAAA